jgi:hypothetical protein
VRLAAKVEKAGPAWLGTPHVAATDNQGAGARSRHVIALTAANSGYCYPTITGTLRLVGNDGR